MSTIHFFVIAAFCMVKIQAQLANGTGCVLLDSCGNLTTGRYHSCKSCTKFVTCNNGAYGVAICSPGTTFNSAVGACDTANSCNTAVLVPLRPRNPNPRVTHQQPNTTTTTTTTRVPVVPILVQRVLIRQDPGFRTRMTFRRGCIYNCYGKYDGYYSSCHGCSIYAYCRAGYATVFRCPYGQSFNHLTRGCSRHSSTCYEQVIPQSRPYHRPRVYQQPRGYRQQPRGYRQPQRTYFRPRGFQQQRSFFLG